MNDLIDSKIALVERTTAKGDKPAGCVRLSQIQAATVWYGPMVGLWRDVLVELPEGQWILLQERIPKVKPGQDDSWANPPDDPSGFDPNFTGRVITADQARQRIEEH